MLSWKPWNYSYGQCERMFYVQSMSLVSCHLGRLEPPVAVLQNPQLHVTGSVPSTDKRCVHSSGGSVLTPTTCQSDWYLETWHQGHHNLWMSTSHTNLIWSPMTKRYSRQHQLRGKSHQHHLNSDLGSPFSPLSCHQSCHEQPLGQACDATYSDNTSSVHWVQWM